MGDDEVLALWVCLGLGLGGALGWFARGLGVTRLGMPTARTRAALLLTPVASLGALWYALDTDAAIDVRNDVRYQLLFVVMGSVWVFVLPRAMQFVGVSFRDDALERRNVAAGIALLGTVVALASVFTGSNMGEGPSIWNTVETALAATAVLAATVWVLALATAFGDTIAIERDVASGVRFAGWIAASGLVLGRAAAGDWVSSSAMLEDLVAVGWPVVVLLAIAIGLEIALRPKVSSPEPSVAAAGIAPALGYLAVSLVYVASVG